MDRLMKNMENCKKLIDLSIDGVKTNASNINENEQT